MVRGPTESSRAESLPTFQLGWASVVFLFQPEANTAVTVSLNCLILLLEVQLSELITEEEAGGWSLIFSTLVGHPTEYTGVTLGIWR